MKNILFITASVGFGGAAKMLVFIANSLSNRGYNVSIANIKSTTNKSSYSQQVNEGVRLFDAVSSGRKGLKRFEQINSVTKIAKETNADIIIGFTPIPNSIAKIVGIRLNIPSIMSERGDPFITWGNGLVSKIMLFLINRSSGGVFQTEGAKEFYGKGLQKRGKVIPNPIFIKGEIPCIEYKDREKTVVSVARLDNYQKRYDVMLDAFKLFSDKHPEYTLKLYGQGNDEKLIKQWVADRNIENKVEFMGLTTQPMRDIAKDGMFLITSDFEGISNALLEAMAVGLPCVSTDHSPGGARLLITDHENGLLAPIEDSKALADAMCEFAENPELAEKCGENAKDVINRFDPSKIIDMWEEYILNFKK